MWILCPWDRAYSWNRNVLRDPLHQLEPGVSEDNTFSGFVTYHSNQWALRPQIGWIVDGSGNVVVDYVGQFENLENDFKVICERLGVEDTSLPMTLDSGKVSYVDTYDNGLKKSALKFLPIHQTICRSFSNLLFITTNLSLIPIYL